MADKKAKSAGYQVSKLYEVSGSSAKRKNSSCPKCGPGYFLAAHKDRVHCGHCGYMEKKSK